MEGASGESAEERERMELVMELRLVRAEVKAREVAASS